jgi:hypothetical protein
MSEPRDVTMAEIEKADPNEWLLIDRLKKGKTPDVVSGGYVIYHGPDKLAMEAKIDELPRPLDVATLYNGPLIEEGEVLLLNVRPFT